MADGTITFSTALDNAQLEKDLKKAYQDVSDLKRKIEQGNASKGAIEEEMERGEAAIRSTEQALDSLKARLSELENADPMDASAYFAAQGKIEGVRQRIAEVSAELDSQIGAQDALSDKWQKIDLDVHTYQSQLAAATARQTALGAEVARTANESVPAWRRAAEAIRAHFASLGESIRSHMADAANRSVSPWEQFASRVGTMMRRVFVFSLILKGLNAVRNEIGSMLMQNSAFAASVENLKAVFRGFASSLVSAVAPTLIAFANTLAAVFTKIASLIDAIFGTKIVAAINAQAAAASNAAAATGQQAKAAKDLAKEQREANRQIMAFDEINAMSDSGSDSGSDGGGGGGGGGGAGGGIGDLGGGIFQGILDWIDMIKDRILHDLEGPFARIREGLERIAKGWKEVVEGFRTGDLGMIWKGITDIIVGALYVIEGSIDAFLDWLDEKTGGRLHNLIAGIEQILHGFVEVVEGILTGDLSMIADGVVDIFDGARLTIIGFVDAIELAWTALMDWLDEQTGGRFHDIFEGLKETVSGAADFIRGILTADLPLMLEGVREMLEGFALTVDGVVDAICDAVSEGIAEVFDELSESSPGLAGFLQSTKAMFLGVIEGIRTAIKSAVDGACLIVEGAIDLVVGLCTHNGELVKQGVEELATGIKTITEGLADSLRTIIGSMFDWVREGICGAYEYLASKFPQAKNLFAGLRNFLLAMLDVIERAFTGTIEGIRYKFERSLDGLEQIVHGAVDVVVGIFTGSGDMVVSGLRGVVNGFLYILEGLLDGALDGVVSFANGVISGLSVLPGVSIPSITFRSVRLPRLAQGAVIPPNREFMAVLGDQSHGTNIEAPEALLRQVLREEIGPMLGEAILALSSQDTGGGGDVELVLNVDGEQLSRAVSRGNASRVRRGDLKPDIDLAFGI
ncbi:MAG: hypothetical protein IKG69_04895 [Atopobiaceae bacterium]|nr:hypothetical protein [Atopobiaceae bacterium]